MKRMVIRSYADPLRQLGLSSLEAVRGFEPEHRIKNRGGYRDVVRLDCRGTGGSDLTLFLKRVRKTSRKNGLRSLLRRGRVWSVCHEEWDNCQALQAAGIHTAELVAWGEDCGWLGERFSFIITRSADGSQTLGEFLRTCRDFRTRRTVLASLANEVRRMHNAGLYAPDLFTRHIFLDARAPAPRFCLIDMARLDRSVGSPDRLRARDLAALNATAPLRDVKASERLRFLRDYGGERAWRLIGPIRRRMAHLLRRRKYATFLQSVESERKPLGAGESYEMTRRRFDHPVVAARYATRHGGNRRDRREQQCIERALDGLLAGSRVLDLPCGAGRLAPMLHRMGFIVTQADNSPHMVEQACQAWARGCGGRPDSIPGLRFEVRDIMASGYPDGEFDAVVCNRLLHHFVEPQTRMAALRELRRICKGPVIVSFFNADTLDGILFKLKWLVRPGQPKDRVPISMNQFVADAAAAGLQLDGTYPTRGRISPQWYLRLSRK